MNTAATRMPLRQSVSERTQRTRKLAELAKDDFGRFAYDGFGVMLSDAQLEAREMIGAGGPRRREEAKFTFLSGGQRAGKTVFLALEHADSGLYKRGVDNTDRQFWKNYLFKTLAIAPSGELTLKLWQVMSELAKGASDAQWDRRARRSRGGHFINLMRAGKLDKWPAVFYDSGARTDFRSSEGRAFRLEGDQWWFISWDEWASQPDREIQFVKKDVLLGRSRDHDAKIVLAAWPKPETERHLIAAIREIERGQSTSDPHQVVYLPADEAWFTNTQALDLEREIKSGPEWQRTVLGQPAGGASVEFPSDVIENMVNDDLTFPRLPDPEYDAKFKTFISWDVGLGQDSTVGITWAIPRVGVSPDTPAEIVNGQELMGGAVTTIDHISYAIAREQHVYQGESAVDAAAMGGLATVRSLRDLTPRPLAFVSRGNDRIHGNMRFAAIANGLEMLTWGRVEGSEEPWGVVISPRIQELIDQLANFDRDAPKGKAAADDWVWAFLIGLWYIRRFWLVALDTPREHGFDARIIRRQRRFVR